MRIDILGLELDQAKAVLAGEGIEPFVTLTSAPKRRGETAGVFRVIHAADDGKNLTVARFLDPIADQKQENG